jgi:hypothetical protein
LFDPTDSRLRSASDAIRSIDLVDANGSLAGGRLQASGQVPLGIE